MTNLRRLYEDIKMPAGLAVVGDSLAGFNPVLVPHQPLALLHIVYALHRCVCKMGTDLIVAFHVVRTF